MIVGLLSCQRVLIITGVPVKPTEDPAAVLTRLEYPGNELLYCLEHKVKLLVEFTKFAGDETLIVIGVVLIAVTPFEPPELITVGVPATTVRVRPLILSGQAAKAPRERSLANQDATGVSEAPEARRLPCVSIAPNM